ncbi:protein-tyrosine phosphatase family protein [Desulforhopalus vacuolatus]|uniref:protein-tyrosine phosphatase family protein n=1 Tax=Desulforhopalus vacuolatus TaxID=40414 RepID=UPI001F05B9BA|nr:dual specificity protein phosphatase family protein [Desulforhopalus vacuolatus]
MSYKITWLTSQLAVGYAPMSYEELDSIKDQGIGAIVNLCGEFTDLHEIEEQAGFEVCFLPTPDECAPDMEKMKEALEWLDEALYLKKKVLVHCRHGHGRTGTFISAYLLRRGLALKYTEKKLKGTRANPTNYSQWKLLKKYSKQQGQLDAREASIENPATIDLLPFFGDYETLLAEAGNPAIDTAVCLQPFQLQLIEAVYLSHTVNSKLSRKKRNDVLEKALKDVPPEQYSCPLFAEGSCLICDQRPLHCRRIENEEQKNTFKKRTTQISREIFFALTDSFLSSETLHFSIIDTVSGRFVQQYFQAMRDGKKE